MSVVQELLEIKDFLNEKVDKYNHPDFIETDPIQIPHLFSDKNDIEISAFFASTIAWGQRVTIIKNMQKLIALMDHAPYEFVINSSEKAIEPDSSEGEELELLSLLVEKMCMFPFISRLIIPSFSKRSQ